MFIQILFVIRQFNIGCLFPFPIVVDADLECVVGFGTAVEAAFITDDFVFFRNDIVDLPFPDRFVVFAMAERRTAILLSVGGMKYKKVYFVYFSDLIILDDIGEDLLIRGFYPLTGGDIQLIGYSVDLHIELFQYVGNRIGRHELNTADDTLKRDIFVGDFCNIDV